MNLVVSPKLVPLLVVRDAPSAGAVAVFPVMDFCGDRMGRLCDPFGHLWIIWHRVEELSVEDIRRRRDAFAERASKA
jgi:hypothetical protein